ncbi:hypothetical protein AVEN_237013-1, partial [Araneus ventricosus]
ALRNDSEDDGNVNRCHAQVARVKRRMRTGVYRLPKETDGAQHQTVSPPSATGTRKSQGRPYRRLGHIGLYARVRQRCSTTVPLSPAISLHNRNSGLV